ncbi:MAG: hypothetical protein AAFZ58_11755 [Pseudomonadota bacterium]
MARLIETLSPVSWGAQQRDNAADDRLHELYWNRAQLKKEFAALRKERYKLLDALTEEEGRSARLRQKLEFLEDSLADPETANNAVVYFTLRKIWARCRQRLVALSGELRSQREAHATKQLRAQFLAEQQHEIRSIVNRIAAVQQNIEGIEQSIDAHGLELDSATGVFALLRRRRLRAELDETRQRHEEALLERQSLEDARAVAAARKAPEFERLDVESRRAINCTVIAFAEILATHYRNCEVIDWVRMAQEKSVGSAHFGDIKQCQRMVDKLAGFQKTFEQRERAPGFTPELAQLAREIRETGKFRDSSTGIPEADSLYAFGNNVLARDMWNVSQAMLL